MQPAVVQYVLAGQLPALCQAAALLAEMVLKVVLLGITLSKCTLLGTYADVRICLCAGEEEVPPGVVGVIVLGDCPDVLSHCAVRARNCKIPVVACPRWVWFSSCLPLPFVRC